MLALSKPLRDEILCRMNPQDPLSLGIIPFAERQTKLRPMKNKKIVIQTGKGKLKLKKSKELVGLKFARKKARAEKKQAVEKKILDHLGGFQLVALHEKGQNLDKALDKLRAENDVELGTHVYVAEGSTRPMVPTGVIYVFFEEGVSLEEQALVFDEYRLEVVERRSDTEVVVRVTPQSPNPIKVAAYMQKLSLVRRAEPDLDTLVDEYDEDIILPSDPLLADQWYFNNKGVVPSANYPVKRGADARIVKAWERLGNMGSPRVTIAVIDNGFDPNHPDLAAKIYKPYDLWTRSSRLTQGDPRFTHGTSCASIALAASNGRGIVGVAPNARFMPVSGTSFSLQATEEMFDYCIRNGADIISCSWGTTDPAYDLSPIKEAAIAKAARQGRNGKGCVILFAVGNDDLDYISYYAAHPDVIAVAACTSRDTIASYSNRGPEVWVCAPSNGDWPLIAARASWDQGTSLRGPGEFRYWIDGKNRGNQYKHFGGTSGATPLVAGIVALMLSANPDLTAREVKEILKITADKIGPSWEYTNGHSRKYGYGRVNAERAVAEALRRRSTQPQPEPTPTPRPTTPTPQPAPAASAGKLYRLDVNRQAARGWGVQMGVFKEFKNVLIQAASWRKQFKQPLIIYITSMQGQPAFKLVLGQFDNIDEARALLSKVKAAGQQGFLRKLSDFALA